MTVPAIFLARPAPLPELFHSPMDGILVLDKPVGISSARAVAQIKRLLPRGTKIGHAGTLDPFATGVLLLLIGKSTKLCEKLMDEPKQYQTTVKLGATSPTDDPEAPEELRSIVNPPHIDQVDDALKAFTGSIRQRPPAFSAMKINGQRAYDLARAGREVRIQPRTVQVYAIKRLNYEWPFLSLCIDCGRGTYIRAIARDLGEALEVGGYLTALRRTRVGPFTVNDAITIEQAAQIDLVSVLKLYPLQ